jgi:NTP pyrophosphatase (non-canonical NTP hydrolase)
MSDIKLLTEKIVSFRDARDWKQFHNPKDLAISLSLEASELMENFQWKNADEINELVKNKKKDISRELADVLYWVLLMSHDMKIDIMQAVADKMKENEQKYPVKKSRGKHTKYTEL